MMLSTGNLFRKCADSKWTQYTVLVYLYKSYLRLPFSKSEAWVACVSLLYVPMLFVHIIL